MFDVVWVLCYRVETTFIRIVTFLYAGQHANILYCYQQIEVIFRSVCEICVLFMLWLILLSLSLYYADLIKAIIYNVFGILYEKRRSDDRCSETPVQTRSLSKPRVF